MNMKFYKELNMNAILKLIIQTKLYIYEKNHPFLLALQLALKQNAVDVHTSEIQNTAGQCNWNTTVEALPDYILIG